jgi:hypothetical protein
MYLINVYLLTVAKIVLNCYNSHRNSFVILVIELSDDGGSNHVSLSNEDSQYNGQKKKDKKSLKIPNG